jgi:apolipoprotein N-acyltransferase
MRLLASILSAILLIFAFAPFGAGVLAFVAFVPLLYSLHSKNSLEVIKLKREFFYGWLFGVVFFLGTVYWVVNTMHQYGGVPFVAAVLVMLLLVSFLALFPAVFILLVKLTSGQGPIVRLIFLPSLWVALELIRGWFFTGFPWVLLGYSQIDNTAIVQIADIVGVWGLSFLVMMVNVAVCLSIHSIAERKRPEFLSLTITVFLLLSAYAYGSMKVDSFETLSSEYKELKVALAQGNIDQGQKWNPDYRDDTIEIYRELTLQAKEQGAEFIVWPETAVPAYFPSDEDAALKVRSIATEGGMYLLTGAPHYEVNFEDEGYSFYNSAFLLNDIGEDVARYDKVHLVPFGEYVPLKDVLFFIKKLTHGIGDFKPGTSSSPLFIDEGSIGVLICYEVIFPHLAAMAANEGATMLVNITNDAWFGRSSAPYQHLDMSRLRAVENGLYLVRAANTGISAIVDPLGRVIESGDIFTRELVSGTVRLRGDNADKTFFTKYSWFVPSVALVLSLAFLFNQFYRRFSK